MEIAIFGQTVRVVAFDHKVTNDHPMVNFLPQISNTLRDKIASACFQHYEDAVESIDVDIPSIKGSHDIWAHVRLVFVRLELNEPKLAAIEIRPEWDDRGLELVVSSESRLVYAGSVRVLSLNSYKDFSVRD